MEFFIRSVHRYGLIATGTPRESACTMVFTVLLDFAEFLKSEIFSGAVIGTTSFRLAFLIGPVFSRFIDWECVYIVSNSDAISGRCIVMT